MNSLLDKNKLYFAQGTEIKVRNHNTGNFVTAIPISPVWEDDNDFYCTFLFYKDGNPTGETWNCYWNDLRECWETCEA